jgi:hypothetical protein
MAGSTALVDPRGLRFAASLTAIVLAIVLITGSPILLGAQAVVFAIGAFLVCGGRRTGCSSGTRWRSGLGRRPSSNPRARRGLRRLSGFLSP